MELGAVVDVSVKSDPNARRSIRPSALNLDIMVHIMRLVSRQTLSSLMKTCRDYYSIGVPIILRSSMDWHVKRTKQMRSFKSFMFATSPGNADRFQFLHSIEWPFMPPQKGPIQWSYMPPRRTKLHELETEFLGIISRSRNLRKITFLEPSKHILSLPNALDTFAGLTRLVEVIIINARELLEFLQRVRSPISTLTVTLLNTGPPPDLLPMIAHLRDTLVSLEVGNVMLNPHDACLQFPQVRKLSVRFNNPETVFVSSTIFRIFPNLEELYLCDPMVEASYDEPNDDKILQDHLASSKKGETLKLPQKFLKKLEGSVVDLFRGAYLCVVENLHIAYLDEYIIGWLPPLLFQMQPRSLTVTLGPSRFDSDGLSHDVLRPLFEELATTKSLKTLSIRFDFSRSKWGGIIRNALADLIRDLGRSKLEIEALKISCIAFGLPSEEFPSDNDQLLWEHEMDDSQLAQEIAQAVPTIRTVTLLRGPSESVTRFVRVAASSG